MNRAILQVILFIIILLFIIFIFRIFISLKKEKRIAKFALENDINNVFIFSNLYIKFWKFIHTLSKDLGSYELINKISKKYDKYILKTEYKYKKNIDYFTIKIVFIILVLILNIIVMCFNLLPVNIITLSLSVIIAYFIPDLFWQYTFQKKVNKVNKDLFLSIRCINFSLNNNSSIKEGICYASKMINTSIKDELDKINDDLEHGLSLANAYKRFYKRCKLRDILYIYLIINYGEKLNISYKDIFNNIYNYLKEKYDHKDKFIKETDIYNYLFLIALIIPLLLYIFIVFLKPNYFNKLFTGLGIFILISIIIIYTLFIYIVRNLLEVKDE